MPLIPHRFADLKDFDIRSLLLSDNVSPVLRGADRPALQLDTDTIGYHNGLYHILSPFGDGRWMRYTFAASPNSVPNLWGIAEGIAVTSVHSQKCTRSGSWTDNAGDYYWGKSYYYATAADAYIEQAVTGHTLFLRTPYLSTCGYALVSIDGSYTAATALPTVTQALIDAGSFAAGDIGRTYIDFYANTSQTDEWTLLAEGLTDAAHTVRVTAKGTKRTASSSTRVPISAICAATSGLTLEPGSSVGGGIASVGNNGNLIRLTTNSAHGLTTGDVLLITGCSHAAANGHHRAIVINTTTLDLRATNSPGASGSGGAIQVHHNVLADVRAQVLPRQATLITETCFTFSYAPAGGGTEWMGGFHGNESLGAAAYYADNVAQVLLPGQIVFGDEIALERSTTLNHTQQAAMGTKRSRFSATHKAPYRLQEITEMQVLVGGTVQSYYPVMCPAMQRFHEKSLYENSAYNKVRLGAKLVYGGTQLSANDGAYYPSSDGAKGIDFALFFSDVHQGYCGIFLPRPDLSMESYADAGAGCRMEDRTDGNDKVYMIRFTSRAISPGDRFLHVTHFLGGRLQDADALLG